MATEMFFKADVQRKSAHITDSSGRDFGVNVKRRYKKAQKPSESYCNFGDATCGLTWTNRTKTIFPSTTKSTLRNSAQKQEFIQNRFSAFSGKRPELWDYKAAPAFK